MSLRAKKAISMIEIAFAGFVIFFIYTFVIKQMIADMKFSDLRRNAATIYTILDGASRDIMLSGGYKYRMNDENDLIKLFAQKLQVGTYCKDAQKEECWSANWILSESVTPGLKLETGQYIVAEVISPSCSSSINLNDTCAALYVDTNGSLAPNLVGHDMIKIYITANGLVAAGVKADIMNPAQNCDMVKEFNWGCSAKLLGIK